MVLVDLLNSSAADMLVAVPLTSKLRNVVWHVAIEPPEGGTTRPLQIECDHIRAISPRRLIRRMGMISPATHAEGEDRQRVLLDL